MTPSEFARLYRQVDDLTEEQAQMLARLAVRKIANPHVRWATAEKILTGLSMGRSVRELRDLQTTLAIHMQIVETSARQEAS